MSPTIGITNRYFFVKWVGYSAEEATWEPLGHMNDNCRELVAKAHTLLTYTYDIRLSNKAIASPLQVIDTYIDNCWELVANAQ